MTGCERPLTHNRLCMIQIEKSQGEIYRLRAKLESTQTENENFQDELEKMQQALNRAYSDRDKFVSDLDKLREELERSQVRLMSHVHILYIALDLISKVDRI